MPPRPANGAGGTASSAPPVGQIGEDLVDEPRRARRVDCADDADMQSAARHQAAREIPQFGALDRGEALLRAMRRQPVGMARKDARAPGAARHRRGVVRLVAELRVHLLAHALERRLVETRRVDAKAQQFAGAVEMAHQRAHPPADMIALAME